MKKHSTNGRETLPAIDLGNDYFLEYTKREKILNNKTKQSNKNHPWN